MGTMGHRFPQCRHVIVHAAQSVTELQVGIGYHGGGVVAYHTITMSGTCPFGKETALLIDIHKPGLNFHVLTGVSKVQQGKQRTEGVPEAGVGIQIPLLYFAVVRTVMEDFAFCVHLIETAGKQQGPVKAAVEGAQTVDVRTICYLNPSQNFIPS